MYPTQHSYNMADDMASTGSLGQDNEELGDSGEGRYSVAGTRSVSSRRSRKGRGGKSVDKQAARLRALQAELVQAKEARKLVEQDAQLLANRIALLKQEEEKAWKKIRQTKARAGEIVRLRAENEARVLERQAAAQELSQQQQEVIERHYHEKELQRKARQRLQATKEREKRRMAQEVKAAKALHKREVEKQRKADVLKARRTKAAIKMDREAARKRREASERERLKRNKVEYDRRVAAEERLRQAKEGEVSRLEALEMQLIERLKKTQAQQQKAYQDLEVALAGSS